MSALVVRSGALQRVVEVVDRAARASVPVVLVGPSGVGKEVLARRLHTQSPRANAAFVAVACGAIPEALAESLLFGHTRGAFSGAERDAIGHLQAADGGTLFLDDIGGLGLAVQAKLLRALDAGEVAPLGGAPLRVDVRLVVASGAPLEDLAAEGRLREDLCYRLSSITVAIPPLRERPADLQALIDETLAAHGCELAAPARARLMGYGWPGNVRELLHVLHAAAVLADGKIDEGHLPPRLRGAQGPDLTAILPGPGEDLRVRPRVAALEKLLMAEALRRHQGNRRAAARALGLSPRAFLYKLRGFGLDGSGEETDRAE